MKFCSLSDREIKAIEKILIRYNIDYNIVLDEQVIESNKISMQNDIRHLSMSTLSDGLFTIEISDDDIKKIDSEGKVELERYNIFIDIDPS